MFDFLKYRVMGLVFSFVLIGSLVGLYFYKGGLQYSVEFTGGTQIQFKFEKPMESKALLNALTPTWPGAIARKFTDTQILIRIPVGAHEGDARGLADRARETIQGNFADNPVTIEKSEVVGPGVGADLRWKSIYTVLLALLLMMLYIAFRFWSVAFAAGAVAALFHDVIIVLGLMLFFGRDISINVIGAVLVVLAYSINDTIVIFSRMRANIKKMSSASLYEIVNTSLNQTFKRTLLTSFSTVVAVGSMFALGGEALRDLSVVILLGIFFGTYSSIYIASPTMMLLYKKEK